MAHNHNESQWYLGKHVVQFYQAVFNQANIAATEVATLEQSAKTPKESAVASEVLLNLGEAAKKCMEGIKVELENRHTAKLHKDLFKDVHQELLKTVEQKEAQKNSFYSQLVKIINDFVSNLTKIFNTLYNKFFNSPEALKAGPMSKNDHITNEVNKRKAIPEQIEKAEKFGSNRVSSSVPLKHVESQNEFSKKSPSVQYRSVMEDINKAKKNEEGHSSNLGSSLRTPKK